MITKKYIIKRLNDIINYGEVDNKIQTFNFNVLDIIIDSTIINTSPQIYGTEFIAKTLYYNEEQNLIDYKQYLNKFFIISNDLFCILTGVDSTSLKFKVVDYFIPSNYIITDQTAFLYRNTIYIFSFDEKAYPSLKSHYRFADAIESSKYFNKYIFTEFLKKIKHTLTKRGPNQILRVYLDSTDLSDEFYTKIQNYYINLWVFTYDKFVNDYIIGESFEDDTNSAIGTILDAKSIYLYPIPAHYSVYVPPKEYKNTFNLDYITNTVNFNDVLTGNIQKIVLLFTISTCNMNEKVDKDCLYTSFYYIII